MASSRLADREAPVGDCRMRGELRVTVDSHGSSLPWLQLQNAVCPSFWRECRTTPHCPSLGSSSPLFVLLISSLSLNSVPSECLSAALQDASTYRTVLSSHVSSDDCRLCNQITGWCVGCGKISDFLNLQCVGLVQSLKINQARVQLQDKTSTEEKTH